jgi:hypothetical protein
MSRVVAGSLFLLFASSSLQAGVILNEGFDNIATLPGSGWAIVNNSNPVGTTSWFQGNPGIFPSQAGAPDSYIAANFNSAGFVGTTGGNISNWLITPVLSLQYNLQFVFYTRTELGSPFPDRLELRLSTSGASTNVGTTDTSVGDFTNLVLSVNPTLSIGGYPEDWTRITANFVGVGFSSASGRFAFRYNVPDNITNGDYIGIDSVSVTQDAPEPATLGLIAFGLGALALRRTRRGNPRHS